MSDASDPVNGTPHVVGASSDELPLDTRDVSHVIAYDLREDEQPGGPDGLKVRWVCTVVTGQRAQEADARQAAAIMKALQWLHDNPPESGKPSPGKPE